MPKIVNVNLLKTVVLVRKALDQTLKRLKQTKQKFVQLEIKMQMVTIRYALNFVVSLVKIQIVVIVVSAQNTVLLVRQTLDLMNIINVRNVQPNFVKHIKNRLVLMLNIVNALSVCIKVFITSLKMENV